MSTKSAPQVSLLFRRNANALTLEEGADPRQDDYDIWLGTGIIKPWIALDG
jgi:hypothetical protein